MRASFNRRTATKVKDGRVQRKNRRTLTAGHGLLIDRESPGVNARHVVSKRDLQRFIEIIPDWPRLSDRLERVTLSAADSSADAYYYFYHREKTGAIYLHAWDEDLWVDLSQKYFDDHAEILVRLGVSSDATKEGVLCRFTESQARAFVLLHVFLHELGHHQHFLRMKHRSTEFDENYAERFAAARFQSLYAAYIEAFGDPGLSKP
jgi:hypothetical protein